MDDAPDFDENFVEYDQSQIPSLNADAESSSYSDEENTPPKKKRGPDISYIEHRRFVSVKEFLVYWAAEQSNWRVKKKDHLADSDVELWYCKYARMRAYSCPQRLRLVFPHDNNSVIVYLSKGEHDHDAVEGASALTPQVKTFIKEQLRNGLTAQRIRVLLTEHRFPSIPTLQQVQNFVQRQRKDESAPFTDVQLKDYCTTKSVLPDDIDEPYVFAWEYVNAERFFVLWTTDRLRALQFPQTCLQADATNCVNWHAYPLGVYGYSDVDRHFTPTHLSLGPSEDNYHYSSVFGAMADSGYEPGYVLGDGHAGLTKAVRDQFPDAVRLMCYAHTDRRIDKRINSVPAMYRDVIRRDIEALRYVRSEAEFDRLVPMMIATWPDAADGFKVYFENTWTVGDLKLWFESASPFGSTNNGLESTNRQIKNAHTLRKKLPLPRFLEAAESVLRAWSKAAKTPPAKPTPKPHLYKDAHSLQTGENKRLIARIPNRDVYVFASSESKFMNMEQVKAAYRAFLTQPNTWAQFLQARFKVHVVSKMISDACVLYWCSCKEGARKRLCKHALHIMCSPDVGMYAYPADVTAEPLAPKRKRAMSGIKRIRTYFDGEAMKKDIKRSSFTPAFKPKRRSSDGRPCKTLCVYRLMKSVTEGDVRKLFERFGPVTNVIKPEDHVAFVVMGRFADAKTAKKHLDLSWKREDNHLTLRAVELNSMLEADGYSRKAGASLRVDFRPGGIPGQFRHLLRLPERGPSVRRDEDSSPTDEPTFDVRRTLKRMVLALQIPDLHCDHRHDRRWDEQPPEFIDHNLFEDAFGFSPVTGLFKLPIYDDFHDDSFANDPSFIVSLQ